LRQFGTAAHNHLDAHGIFPTNGWGWRWIGDPDRGVGWRQPGGWMYNLLPYLEQVEMHDMQKSLPEGSAERLGAAKCMLEMPMSVFNCPSRRPAIQYPTGKHPSQGSNQANPFFAATVTEVGRSDYASNGGTVMQDCHSYTRFFSSTGSGPTSIGQAESDKGREAWEKIADISNGVFFPACELKITDVEDGASCTYMFGEKFINADDYTTGLDPGDNENLLMGDNGDITRWGGPNYPPIQDTPGADHWRQFGSAHPGTFNMVLCDGSVVAISYSINLEVHGQLANRRDGIPVDMSAL
jgi:prepilin-type processing-associated H-X9-DG protein